MRGRGSRAGGATLRPGRTNRSPRKAGAGERRAKPAAGRLRLPGSCGPPLAAGGRAEAVAGDCGEGVNRVSVHR